MRNRTGNDKYQFYPQTIDEFLATVRLTSIYYRVSGNQKFCFAPNETTTYPLTGRSKK
jgi:hypothetical protein